MQKMLVWKFTNGLYDIESDAVLDVESCPVVHTIDLPFPVIPSAFMAIPTPCADSIIQHQLFANPADPTPAELEKELVLWALLGRLLRPRFHSDTWPIYPLISGVKGSGKMVLGRMIRTLVPDDTPLLAILTDEPAESMVFDRSKPPMLVLTQHPCPWTESLVHDASVEFVFKKRLPRIVCPDDETACFLVKANKAYLHLRGESPEKMPELLVHAYLSGHGMADSATTSWEVYPPCSVPTVPYLIGMRSTGKSMLLPLLATMIQDAAQAQNVAQAQDAAHA